MPDLGTLLGTPLDFEFAGKVYKVFPRDLETEGRFGHWAADESLKGVIAHADTVGPDLLAVLLEGWRHDKASRLYEWGSFICQRLLRTDAGTQHLAYLQMGRNKGLQRSLIDQIWKDDAKRQELLARMAEASGDPSPNARSEAEGQVEPEPSPSSSPAVAG